jgi:hypothetical protein
MKAARATIFGVTGSYWFTVELKDEDKFFSMGRYRLKKDARYWAEYYALEHGWTIEHWQRN